VGPSALLRLGPGGRTVASMKANHRSPVRALRTLMLPRDERAAARAERRVEAHMRSQRDNEHSAERRAAAVQAEAWRERGGGAWRT
jgi:hypothetical protein